MDSLYQISQRYNNLVALLDDDAISQDEVNNALLTLEDELQEKGENCIKYLDSVQDKIDAAKANKKKLDAYIKALESRKKRVEKACIYALDTLQVKSIMTGWGELKAKKNPPAVIIDDVAKIPTRYQRQKIQVDIDKVAIKAAIKAGEEVPGAHLEQGISLSY
jgi:predicted ribosome quality control (RQC) complex YloA/Tae2 family protein